MKTFAIVSLCALAVVLLCFAGIGIKVLLRKGQFKRACSNVDPYTGKHGGCACADMKRAGCNERTQHPYQPLQVPDLWDGEKEKS